ncbi:MAG TPA: efflux RND transporter periplasmic adaptor subunit, partial [Gemmatimonadaceae bacterium]|nr:efflux RND transporter periplasmic adaptor subunit [Gemmatimonadaceae bacterium]
MSTSAPPNVAGNGQATTPKPATSPSAEPAPVAAPKAESTEVETAPPVAPMANRRVLWLGVVAAIVLIGLLIVGILPRRSLQKQLNTQVASAATALPIIAVAKAQRPTAPNTVMLPGTMEALHEAALYARVPGYVRRWYADLGTPVRAGQILADIDVPELQQSVLQARAQLAQMQSALVLARSNLERWRLLAADSAVTAQELQMMQQAYDAAAANVRAAEAFLRGLMSTLQYAQVRAPFSGIVTARNVENGALITAAGASSAPLTAGGSQFSSATTVAAASLFRVAQTDTMRVYISVPQPYVASIHTGLPADLVIANLNNQTFRGTIVRTAGAVDPSTRTLLAEVDVPNPGRVLLPGMYAQVRITVDRVNAPLTIPSTALVSRASGPQVIELIPDANGRATVHLRSVQVARDYGA